MIMEYIEDSLDGALIYLKGARSLVIVPQFIEAVEFMHTKNYVHRDIKPGNILIQWVNGQPVLKMADVGTMKEADEDLKTFAGTPLYMAPECWSTTRRYSKEVDMWAVGLVLLQLFTDWDPTKDEAWVNGPLGKFNELGSAWISKVLMPLIATAVPESVQQLLRGLLCESPQDRWTATRCQTWVKEDFMPYIDGAIDEASHKRRRDLDQQDPEDEDKPRKIRSSNPTLDTIRGDLASNEIKSLLYKLHQTIAADDSSLPDTLPWDAAYEPQNHNSNSGAGTPTQAPSSAVTPRAQPVGRADGTDKIK
jgi:serine/threonine protein kinase